MNNTRIAKELIKIAKSLTAGIDDVPYYYEMHCYEKRAEQYQYKKGCNGIVNNVSINITVSDRNLKKCVEKAFNQLGMIYNNIDDIFIDDGRIVISREENGNGEQPTSKQIQNWKKGEIFLWLCDYEWDVTIRTDKKPNAEYIENQIKKG